MKKFYFKNNGTYQLGEVNTDELAFMAIQSNGFHIGTDEYAISFNPSEGFYFTCYDNAFDFHTFDIQVLVSKIMEVLEQDDDNERKSELRYQGA